MKPKFLLTIFSLFASLFLLSSCDDERDINPSKLPDAAQSFISQYFPGIEVKRAEKEKDDGRKEYKAFLSNGTEITFDSNGSWISVDCTFSAVPSAIMPTAISQHLAANYPDATPVGIDRRLGGYEVSIVYTNGGISKDLMYNSDGTFFGEEMDY